VWKVATISISSDPPRSLLLRAKKSTREQQNKSFLRQGARTQLGASLPFPSIGNIMLLPGGSGVAVQDPRAIFAGRLRFSWRRHVRRRRRRRRGNALPLHAGSKDVRAAGLRPLPFIRCQDTRASCISGHLNRENPAGNNSVDTWCIPVLVFVIICHIVNSKMLLLATISSYCGVLYVL
jgi:hypothetical protein